MKSNIMGYWKDVAYDISRGMSRETAEKLNAERRYGDKEKAKKIEALAEAEVKINKMK